MIYLRAIRLSLWPCWADAKGCQIACAQRRSPSHWSDPPGAGNPMPENHGRSLCRHLPKGGAGFCRGRAACVRWRKRRRGHAPTARFPYWPDTARPNRTNRPAGVPKSDTADPARSESQGYLDRYTIAHSIWALAFP